MAASPSTETLPTFVDETARLVRQAMTGANVTQTELARLTGIPYMALGRKLDGLRDITMCDIWLIAGALGLAPARLVPNSFLEQKVAA